MINLKRYLNILSVLTFVGTLLSYSFAFGNGNEDEKSKEFGKKYNEIIRKLPASARVVIPEIKIIQSDTSKFDTLSLSDEIRHGIETDLENLNIKIVEREAFKEQEKEIVYSQTGEVDPRTAAKFGKAVGATHMVLCKIIFHGFETDQPKVTNTIRVIDVETMLRIGSVTTTFDMPVPQEQQELQQLQKTQTLKELQELQQQQKTQTLTNESFSVAAGSYKPYSWDFSKGGTLKVDISASFDVHVFVMNEANYRLWNSGNGAYSLASKTISSGIISTSIPRGSNYIVIYNKDSLLTPVSVVMTVTFIPE